MVTPLTVELFIDSAWTDITGHVYNRDLIKIGRGRANEASQVEASQLSLTLDNRDGRFSPRNPLSPLFGKIGRNTPVRVRVAADIRFTGEVSVWPQRWEASGSDVYTQIQAAGILRRLGQGVPAATVGYKDFLLSTAPERYWPLDDGVTATSGVQLGADSPSSPFRNFRAEVEWGKGDLGVTLPPGLNLGDGPGFTRIFGDHSGTDPTAAAVDFVYRAERLAPLTLIVRDISPQTTEYHLLLRADGVNNDVVLSVVVDEPDGSPVETVLDTSGPLAALTDGLTHHVRLTLTETEVIGGDPVHEVFIDGELIFTGIGDTSPTGGLNGLSRILFSYRPDLTQLDSSLVALGHVVSWLDVIPPLAPILTVLRGHAGEPAGRRIQRLCAEHDIPFASIGGPGPATLVEGFEDDTPAVDIAGTWARATDDAHTGTWSLRSAVITHDERSDAVLDLSPGATILRLWWKVSSEADFDFFEIYVDNTLNLQASGLGVWTFREINVAGAATVTFRYVKDISVSAGSDAAWIDDLELTVENPELDDTTLMGRQDDSDVLELLAEAAEADLGILYEPRDSLGLAYRTRKSLYTQTLSVTLDYGTGVFSATPEPVDDDQLTRNDVTVKRPDGGQARAVLSVGPLSVQQPPDGVGIYDTSVTVNVFSDALLPGQASFRMNQGTLDRARYPRLSVPLHGPTFASDPVLTSAFLALDMGDWLEIINLPAWLPPDDVTLVAQGFTEELGSHTWEVRVATTPAEPFQIALYGSGAGLGPDRYDTAGSELSVGVDASETLLSVADVGGTLWTVAAAEFPFDILLGGERMTVGGITGTASPQTFTVTRSVNGIVKAHALGTAVALFRTPRYGL